MESDGSVDCEIENESSSNRSRVSNNSEEQPSSPEIASSLDSVNMSHFETEANKSDEDEKKENQEESNNSEGQPSSPEIASSLDSVNMSHFDQTEVNKSDEDEKKENREESNNSEGQPSSPEIASSLDSVNMSHFDQTEANNTDEDGKKENQEEQEEIMENEKPVIDFTDDYNIVRNSRIELSSMESDGSIDGKLENESSPNRSWVSNNSEGQPSSPEMASSLDSVNISRLDQTEANNSDEDEKKENQEEHEETVENKKPVIDFTDDLSDVSDIESNDSFGGEEQPKEEPKVKEKEEEEQMSDEKIENEIHDDKQMDDAVSLHADGEEQLDFEAEEGECSPKAESKKLIKEKEEIKKEKENSDLEEGELTDDNDTKAEETERPVCRFFSRGHCTWGSNCRFIHPGVMDKGNYSMFDTVRPIVTPGAPPPNSGPMMYPVFPPHMPHPHLAGERGVMIPPGAGIRKDEPPTESAWERGLRQAKEMIRKSSKRKETEVDFEDKKMNLTLSQDEIDKENDYYSRHSGSPVKSPDLAEKWKMEAEAKSHRADPYPNDLPPSVPHPGADVPPLGYYPPLHHGLSRPDYWNPHRMGGLPYDDYAIRAPHLPYGPDFYSAAAGRRYMHPNSYYPPRAGGVGPPPHHQEFYDRKQKHKQYTGGSGREVIVQKNDKPYKDDRYRNRREESPRLERVRDDEWADPWMRTKSPANGRRRRRKNTYSSGSSYSSSSESSRSSSRSSFSSRSRQSRSRSKARSSDSRSHSSSRSASEVQTRKKPMQFKLSPSSRPQLPMAKKNPKAISPSLLMERRAATERAMHMNPPPPSPKIKVRPHSPPNSGVGSFPGQMDRGKTGLSDRLLAHSKAAVVAAMRSRSAESKSSKSSSESSSSDSSSDSSDSSGSSSSSSKSSKTPPVRTQKRYIPEDHSSVSQTVKAKAMDALKLSGQKQQIKLTLKGTGGLSQSKRPGLSENSDNRKDRAVPMTKKRIAESSESGSDSDRLSAKKTMKMSQKKGVPSRRDELLKQLKAVEDAIARKRSKNL